MQQSAQNIKTAETPQKVSYLQADKFIVDEKLEESLDVIDVQPMNQESDVKKMIRSKSVTEDDLDCGGHKKYSTSI